MNSLCSNQVEIRMRIKLVELYLFPNSTGVTFGDET